MVDSRSSMPSEGAGPENLCLIQIKAQMTTTRRSQIRTFCSRASAPWELDEQETHVGWFPRQIDEGIYIAQFTDSMVMWRPGLEQAPDPPSQGAGDRASFQKPAISRRTGAGPGLYQVELHKPSGARALTGSEARHPKVRRGSINPAKACAASPTGSINPATKRGAMRLHKPGHPRLGPGFSAARPLTKCRIFASQGARAVGTRHVHNEVQEAVSPTLSSSAAFEWSCLCGVALRAGPKLCRGEPASCQMGV